jgi:hypothetical protein
MPESTAADYCTNSDLGRARECPTCPDVPVSAFLPALAESAPPEVAADLRDVAAS